MLAHANPASYLLALHQSQMPLELPAFPLNKYSWEEAAHSAEFCGAM
jgi:hypothetical protein